MVTTKSDRAGLGETVALAPGAMDGIVTDCANEHDVQALIAHVERKFGRLDILVNNAGIVSEAELTETSLTDWRSVIDTNLTGTFLGCKHAIPAMQRSGGGSIVNIGSINSFVASPLEIAYCAAKGGVVMITKCAALGYAKDRIRVNTVCPGWVQTPSLDRYAERHGRAVIEAAVAATQPLGLGQPEQVASAVVFLASDEASLITGASLLIDGGYTAQ